MRKTLTLLLLVLSIAYASSDAMGYDFSAVYRGNTLYYTIVTSENHDHAVVLSCQDNSHPYSGNIYIPSTVSNNNVTYTVVGIDNFAFCRFGSYYYWDELGHSHQTSGYLTTNLTSVTIPSTVEMIGAKAFYKCDNLSSVYYGGSIEQWCRISFLQEDSPSSDRCSNPLRFAHYLYINDELVTDITIPSSITSIGDNTFRGCYLNSVTIPSSVISIGDYAFYQGRVDTLNITNSVTTIGNRAFTGCRGLYKLTIPNSITTIDNSLFSGCVDIDTVILPNTITSIGEYAFSGCTQLQSISLPNSITTIGRYAFNNCINIDTVIIPNSTTWIGYKAFYGCARLASVTIGNSLYYVADSAFGQCVGLNKVVCAGTIADWCRINFTNTTSNPLCYGHNIYVNDSLLTELKIPANIATIKPYAFYGCNLLAVELPSSVSNIGDLAFGLCTNIQRLNIFRQTAPSVNYQQSGWNSLRRSSFTGVNGSIPINIPVGSIESYYASNWSLIFSNFIEAIDSLIVTANNTAFGSVLGDGLYLQGDSVEISAIANMGYYFSMWDDSITTNPRIVAIGERSAYTAIFEPYYYTVSVFCDSTLGNVSGSGYYPYNTLVSLTATPIEHYHFTNWDDGNTTNPRNFRLRQDTMFVANFAINSYHITVNRNNSTRGTVSGGGNYSYGDTAIISATANDGYHFTMWSDSITDNPRLVPVVGSMTFTAIFEPNNYVVTLLCDSTMGSVSGAGFYPYYTNAILTATENNGYQFSEWNDGNTQNPRTIRVQCDTTLTAIFEVVVLSNYTITVMASPTYAGTVTGGGIYEEGSEITLTATANTGYHFVQWHDGNTSNPRTITVNGDATYTATFAQDAPTTYTITTQASPANAGIVTGGGTYNEGATATLTATANAGYHFVQWQDGNTNNPRTITVNGDAAYIATFEANGGSGGDVDDCHWYTNILPTDQPHYTLGHDRTNGIYTYAERFANTGTVVIDTISLRPATVSSYAPYASSITLAIMDEQSGHPGSTLASYSIPYANFAEGIWNLFYLSNPVRVTGNYYIAFTCNQSPSTDDFEIYVTDDRAPNTAWAKYGNTWYTITDLYTAEYQFSFFIETHACPVEVTNYTIAVQSSPAYAGTVTGGGTYEEGSSVTLTAVASTGYHFVQWQDGNTSNPRTITVTGNATYTAAFEADGGGDDDNCLWYTNILPSDQLRYTLGHDRTNDIYTYAERFVNSGMVAIDTIRLKPATVSSNTPNSSTITIAIMDEQSGHPGSTLASYSVPYSSFAEDIWNVFYLNDPVHVTGNYYISFTCNQSPSTDNFAIYTTDDRAPNSVWVKYGGNWYSATELYTAEYRISFYIETHACAVTTRTITVQASPSNAGTVTGGGTYAEGATATLKATPKNGYRFVRWNDNNTQSTRTVTVTADATYIAYFQSTQDIESADEADILVYPNPTTGVVTIEAEGLRSVEVLDMLGRVLMQSQNARIDLSGQAEGTYLLRITAESGVATKRIVKQ